MTRNRHAAKDILCWLEWTAGGKKRKNEKKRAIKAASLAGKSTEQKPGNVE